MKENFYNADGELSSYSIYFYKEM